MNLEFLLEKFGNGNNKIEQKRDNRNIIEIIGIKN
jgi:hypothetical protein